MIHILNFVLKGLELPYKNLKTLRICFLGGDSALFVNISGA